FAQTFDASSVGAGNVTATTARLNGIVEANNVNDVISIVFRYGTTSGGPYTQTATASPDMLDAGDPEVDVTADISGLTPSTTYYYIVEATDDDANVETGVELSFLTTGNTTARTPGLLVNELGNLFGNCGFGGNEFIELLVLGDESDPLANVDLSNWIVDDNNGDFSNGNPDESGEGISTGHLRLSATCFNSIPPGSLIVLFNDGDTCTANGLVVDETDSNSDGVYIFGASSTCIEENDTYPRNPGGSSSGNLAYSGYDLGTYSNTGTGKWQSIAFVNSGDAVQVRRPDFSFFHGYSYDGVSGGTSGSNFPSYPNGNAAFNSTAAPDFGLSGCANATTPSGVISVTSGSETPGLANNPDNQVIIDLVRLGTIVYDELVGAGASSNCTSFPVEWLSFEGEIQQSQAFLTWETANEVNNIGFDVERETQDGIFERIGFVPAGKGQTSYRYTFVDDAPTYGLNTYRLKQQDVDGQYDYSTTLSINFDPGDAGVLLQTYPNPTTAALNLRIQSPVVGEATWEVYSLDGRKLT
ncbi:MAG: hypothetical protein AAFR59_12890, partial [Bacteroidota bacterium]